MNDGYSLGKTSRQINEKISRKVLREFQIILRNLEEPLY